MRRAPDRRAFRAGPLGRVLRRGAPGGPGPHFQCPRISRGEPADRAAVGSAPLRRLPLLLALAGCAATLPEPETASLRVEGARIRIAAPEGLCVDPRSLDVTREGGFLLLADCVLFDDAPDRPVGFDGVLAVSISTGGLPEDLGALADLLEGPGRGALGRSNDPEAISILDTRIEGDTLFLKVRDDGGPVIPGTQATGWRVFFPAGPRLVTAAVIGFEGAELSDSRALDLLRALIAATQAANPTPAAASPVTGGAASG